jgi:hypothetical protein
VLGEAGGGQLLREGARSRGVKVSQQSHRLEQGRRARGLQRHGEVVKEPRGKRAEVVIAFHDKGKHGTALTCQPLLSLLKLGVQTGGGNRRTHSRADGVRGHLRIQQGLAHGLKALEGGPHHRAVPLRSRIERVLSAAIRGRHELGVHVNELIERLVIRVVEKADSERRALGCEEAP